MNTGISVSAAIRKHTPTYRIQIPGIVSTISNADKEEIEMFAWLFPSWWSIKGPRSGDIDQNIATITRLLSPQFELNFKGDEKIEAQVLADVASYGTQIGVLSEAVLEIAGDRKSESIDELRKLVDDVREVKRQHKHRLERRVRDQLDDLKERDQELLKRVIQDYQES